MKPRLLAAAFAAASLIPALASFSATEAAATSADASSASVARSTDPYAVKVEHLRSKPPAGQPSSSVGLLQINHVSGTPSICSAAWVADAVIVTAGHCFHTVSGQKIKSVDFFSGYYNTGSGNSSWAFRCTSRSAWALSTAEIKDDYNADDFAVVAMPDKCTNKSTGQLSTRASFNDSTYQFGLQTWGFNGHPIGTYVSYGYPIEPQMDGHPDKAGQVRVTGKPYRTPYAGFASWKGYATYQGASGGPVVTKYGDRWCVEGIIQSTGRIKNGSSYFDGTVLLKIDDDMIVFAEDVYNKNYTKLAPYRVKMYNS